MILPKTLSYIQMYTTQNWHRSKQLHYYLHDSKDPHRVYVSWMLWGLSSFWAHYWPLTKWKVLGSAANASYRPLYQSGVVENHCFLGDGMYFWSWITQIHTLAPSRNLLFTLLLQCLANACYKAYKQLGAIYIVRSSSYVSVWDLYTVHSARS